MNDQINEVGKILGKTKKNAEAALRRYSAKNPTIERTRDIFDESIPFEMEFKTRENEKILSLDLFFNKPPPLKNCFVGRFNMNCQEFTVTSGDHLIQVTARYVPGSVSVYVNGVPLPTSNWYEYDPVNGLVWVQGTATTQVITICYIRDSWVTCPPDFIATDFIATPNDFSGIGENFNSLSANSFGAFATSVYPGGLVPGPPGNFTDFCRSNLAPDLTGVTLPPTNNVRLTFGVRLSSEQDLVEGETEILIGFGSAALNAKLFISDRALFPSQSGFYVSVDGGAYFKVSDSLEVRCTFDNNEARGTLRLETPFGNWEVAAHTGSYTLTTIYGVTFFDITPIGATTHGALTYFDIGCSMEAPVG